MDGLDVPPQVLADQLMGQQLPLDPVGVGLGPVALGDGHDDWN